MQPSNPFPQTFLDLARSLHGGSLQFETLHWDVMPALIQDTQYHVDMTMMQHTMTGKFAELNKRFERVHIPGVVEWIRQ